MAKLTCPPETPEELIERVRREHGDRAAEIVAAELAKPIPTSTGRRPIFRGDKRSRKIGRVPVRGKAARWQP